jgi:hypothetical protein
VKDIAELRYNFPVSINALMRAFAFPRSGVQAALALGLDEPGQRGKHIAIDQDREQQIVDQIEQNTEEGTPITRGEILDYCTSQFKIKFTRGRVNSFLLPHSHEVLQTKSVAQEGQRSEVPRVFLERIIQDLYEYIHGCVAELMFILDVVGISDWEDHKTKKIIVLVAMFRQTMHHGVSRNVKHISMIACPSAAGESLLHYIIISQNSSTVQEHLKKQGVRFGREFALKFNQKPYFNVGIFLAYIRSRLLIDG